MNRTAMKLLATSAAYFQLDEIGAKHEQPKEDRFNKKGKRLAGRGSAASKRRTHYHSADWR